MLIKKVFAVGMIGILAFAFYNCAEPTARNNSIFLEIRDEIWDGNGYYPFPEGIYVKYDSDKDTTKGQSSEGLLNALKDSGVDVREAWSIFYITNTKLYQPFNLTIRLRDRSQPIDTTKFSYIDKPRCGYRAKIRHYILW